MNIISDILYWISTGLLVPVIVLLIVLFGRALLLVGSFYGQYLSIRKTEALLRNELNALTPATVTELAAKLPEKSSSLVISYIRQVLEAHDSPAQVQRLLANFEIAADKDLAISKTLTKLGPILGLMGTLIPMGPALAGLASGDIASMAYNMQIAFATTVVGLVAGAVGFLTQQVKQRWYLQDMTNLEFLSELLIRKRRDAAISRSCPDVCTTTSIRGRPNSADGISFKSLTRPKASRTGSTPSIYNTCAMVAPPVSMNSADQSV